MTTWIILARVFRSPVPQMMLLHTSNETRATTFKKDDNGNVCNNNSFIEACLHADRHKSSSALRQPGCVGKCFCSNYSLVLGKRGRERERERETERERDRERKKDQLKWNLRRSPQLPGLSDCCGCKFLSDGSSFSFRSFIRVCVDVRDTHLQVQSTVESVLSVCPAERQNGPCHSGRTVTWRRSQRRREGGREWGEHRWKWHCSQVVFWTKTLVLLKYCIEINASSPIQWSVTIDAPAV